MFIELTNNKEKNKHLINLDNVESFTQLNEGTIIHFIGGSPLTVQESYEEITAYLSGITGAMFGAKYY